MTILDKGGNRVVGDLSAVVEVNLQHRQTVPCDVEDGVVRDQGAVVQFELREALEHAFRL